MILAFSGILLECSAFVIEVLVDVLHFKADYLF